MTDLKTQQRAIELEKQIQSLQHELQSPMDTAGTASPRLAVEDAQRLKRKIDDFRLFLWAYVDSWAERRSDPAARLQRIRLQAVADMVNLLREELAEHGLPDNPEARAVRLALDSFSQTVF